MQRHEPGPAELRVAHDERSSPEIEVLTLGRDRLADPHAAHASGPITT